MISSTKLTQILIISLLSGLSFACNQSDKATGELNLTITDATVDGAQSVMVSFETISIKPVNGLVQTIAVEDQDPINLLSYSGGKSRSLLKEQSIPAGDYEWIRLNINQADTFIMDNQGLLHPLVLSESASSKLTLAHGFSVKNNQQLDFTVDFDLRRSVQKNANGDYTLNPALQLIETQSAGQLNASIDQSLYTESCQPRIYVFADMPVDNLNVAQAPVTTLVIDLAIDLAIANTEHNDFSVALLSAGEYKIAFSCDSAYEQSNDAKTSNKADSDMQISLLGETRVTIKPGMITQHHFAHRKQS